MKKSVLFFAAAILLGFGLQSCDKDNNNGGGNGGNTQKVQWVDLGLPSGLLWADRNLGAEKPEDYGNYYAWGETSPKEVYDWNTYAYGNYNALTKYCSDYNCGLNYFTDNLTTLEASDDAATVNIGGGARMPSDAEWQELLDNTISTWTTRNGVYGRLMTASNGKSIFLPAASWCEGSNPYNVGESGFYWSSTLDTYPNNALCLDFDQDDQYLSLVLSFRTRNCGCSVRAVRAKQN